MKLCSIIIFNQNETFLLILRIVITIVKEIRMQIRKSCLDYKSK